MIDVGLDFFQIGIPVLVVVCQNWLAQWPNRPESHAQGRLAGEPPRALRKVGVLFAPIVVVALAAGGAAAAGGIVVPAAAANNPRIELFGPGNRVFAAKRLAIRFGCQQFVAGLRVLIEDPLADVAMHIEEAPRIGPL